MKIWRGNPVKQLTKAYLGALGKSSNGAISSRHREAGHKRRFRLVDYSFLNNAPALIRRFEYDPTRNATLALLSFSNGFLGYSLAARGSKVDSFVYPSDYFKSEADGPLATLGSIVPLQFAPVGSMIYNIELSKEGGGSLSRSGGSGAQIIAKSDDYILVKLASGKFKTVSNFARGQFGVPQPSLKSVFKLQLRKAGQSRWLGRRPFVRGVAMNPIDHPHGGGEGKTSGGRCSVTPWGRLTKGKKTRPKNAYKLRSDIIITTFK